MNTEIEALWAALTTLGKGKDSYFVGRVECLIDLYNGTLHLTKYGEIYDSVNHVVYKFDSVRDLFEAEIDSTVIPLAAGILTDLGDTLATLSWGTYILALHSNLPLSYFAYTLLGDMTGKTKAEIYSLAVTSGVGTDLDGPMGAYPTLYTAQSPIFQIQYPYPMSSDNIAATRMAVLIPGALVATTPLPPSGVAAISETVYAVPMLGAEYVIGDSGVIYRDSSPLPLMSNKAVNVLLGDYASFMPESWFITALATGRIRRNITADIVQLYPANTGAEISPSNVDDALSVVVVNTTPVIDDETMIGAV